jgi:N-acetylmuramoyl-L-alanine amidase
MKRNKFAGKGFSACMALAISLFTLQPVLMPGGCAGAAVKATIAACEAASVSTYRTWAHDSIGVTSPSRIWYLAEGCTAGEFETWILVQNPGDNPAEIDMLLQTGEGQAQGPRDIVPARSRRSYNLGDYVTSYDVSTQVTATQEIICERAMYGGNRTWAHDSIGVNAPAAEWYLAEGSTAGGMETFVLVQNPTASDVKVNLKFQTDAGEKAPDKMQEVTIRAQSRETFKVNDYVTSFNVSTKVECLDGMVVCERAMYGDSRRWAHDSIGVNAPAAEWYLAEGSTAGGMETWVLVQNPSDRDVRVNISFQTDAGRKAPDALQGVTIPAASRRTFFVNDYVPNNYNVSTLVEAVNGGVVCERAMYGDSRRWAHDSIGMTSPSRTWYLAEGCTAGEFETWILVQNPGDNPAEINMLLQKGEGQAQGPRDTVPAHSRRSYNLGDYVTSYDVSVQVTATQEIICERAMYGGCVVCLDPGHADTPYRIDEETGLNTQDWVNEPEIGIVYDIAVRAKAILESRGVRVVMTKQSVYDPVDLKQRAVVANQAHARMIVHIHADAGLAGPTTFYPGAYPYNWKANSDTGRTAYIDAAVQAESEGMARRFHAAMMAYMRQALGAPDGGTVVENRGSTGTGNYGPIFSYDIWSRVPTFTLENNLGIADRYRQEVAQSIAEGVLACLDR